MTLNKAVLLALSSSLVLLIAGLHPARAATTATATVTLKATFTAPPCTLTVPDTVYLGSLVNGTQNHNPVKIDISCPTPASAVIYGEPVGSPLVAGSTTRMAMTGPPGSGGTPAAFWLSTEGKDVDLTGAGATDKTLGFCAGTANRSCTVTPSTLVTPDTPRGQATATVRFSVMYP